MYETVENSRFSWARVPIVLGFMALGFPRKNAFQRMITAWLYKIKFYAAADDFLK